MLVSHRHNFVFLKTRKTAGTSVEMALQPYCAQDMATPVTEKVDATVTEAGIIGTRKMPRKQMEGLNAKWFNHMSADDIADGIGHDTFARYAKITIVRNPFDRLVSRLHWRSQQMGRIFKDFTEKKQAMRDLVLTKNWPDDSEVVHLNGTYCVDHAIRFEQLRDDLHAVAQTLGLDLKYLHLPHTKDTSKSRGAVPVADYFDAETIAKIHAKMGWAFERYGYAATPAEAAL